MLDIIVITLWALSLLLALVIHLMVSADKRARIERTGYKSELPDTWV
jgi:hypothetical protein